MTIKDIDLLCVGETLIDFIGNQPNSSIKDTTSFQRHLGGSPTNVSLNCSKLGLNVSLASTIGNDGLGNYILQELQKNNINTSGVQCLNGASTTIILVSKTTETPDFIPYRDADFRIDESQISDDILKRSKIFHTTCFALSKEQSRATILKKAAQAHNLGCKTSIDLNYSPKIWPNRAQAIDTIKSYCQFNPLIKVSLDDIDRIFENKISIDEMFQYFHDLNVDTVCLTKGSDGVVLSQRDKNLVSLPAKQIENIKDATGAGDAFWAGFLYGYIKKFPLEKSIDIALNMASIKLQSEGPITMSSENLTQLLIKK